MDTTTPLHPAPPPPLQLRSAPIRMVARWSLGHWASGIGGFILYGFFAVVSGAYGFSLVLGLLTSGAATVIVWIGLPLLVADVSVA